MVGVMRFTWDIYRLLGLGSEAPSAQGQEEMECGAATPDPTDDVTLSQEQDISGEDSLSEEEKAKRRVERRRAKRKRQRERKKLEQVKMPESTEQDAEDEDDDGGESEEEEADESDSELEEEEQEEEKEDRAAIPCSKEPPAPSPAPSGTKVPQKTAARHSEEEPEWDVSCAFFANAASHIRPKGWTKPGRKSKENEGRTREVNGTDAVTKRSASLTEKGIKLVQEGQYSQAIVMFTEAIRYDPKDYRFFGNRSYCYSCLEQYPQALSDAERSIQLAPDWPKGHFRKGSALIGMKRYSEAEKAMEQVLKLDKDCEEAVNDLFNCKVLQLMDLGFEEGQSVSLLERFTTLQAVLTSPEASRVVSQDSSLGLPGSPCVSLWVGNVTAELTEKHLLDLFKAYGEIDSIRVLHERFCAFVNFKNANMASRAMEKLNYVCSPTGLQYREHKVGGSLPRPPQPEGSAHPPQDQPPCIATGSCWSQTLWPSERRRVLLLEDHRLPFWGQVSLQTHC
ncbi:tetratricopeptide repeat protein 31-like isoform X5 [Salvelinus alpinus]|uniref:tetratricopeptide repeat protein 31-like isoform X5 n=1 Tax=Salvelinus alpinus TaxID=8036 RepID=UPI0039FBE28B